MEGEQERSVSTSNNGIVKKLANLQVYLPGQQRHIYEFAKFLAQRAYENMTPNDFKLMADLAIEDLIRGHDANTGNPIKGPLSYYPKTIWTSLYFFVPKISDAIFIDNNKIL
ncbi:hypothetical protein CVV38_02560 [Candidatus Peregrinibacteria bacterium HGW-Peregrinibacteria-1]|jgi:hypothetical protein|nr:MAG: hypothetical protein CVV38_02560 [Candidatus Peregrinibacteria bacterium HGW-Peregrinibacteria-1]